MYYAYKFVLVLLILCIMRCNYSSTCSDSSNSCCPHSFKKIAFVGAGCYGTAIAQSFSERVDEIVMISNSEETKEIINHEHISKLLGNAPLSSRISCATTYSSIKDAEIVFITVPAGAVPEVCEKIKGNEIHVPLVLCSKGLDMENSRLLSEMVEDILGNINGNHNDLLIFSGPSFANEVVRGFPFGVNIAGKNLDLAKEVARKLSSKNKPRSASLTSHNVDAAQKATTECVVIEPIADYIGLQISGAFKNILAIGCGMRRGANLGTNAIIQFMVKGINEIGNLIEAMGGSRETLLELGGIGDITLTCTGALSRNGRFGEFLARGGTLESWEGALAEGVFAAKAVPGFSKKYGVKMPAFEEIFEAIYGRKGCC